ncbi:hypothetical protein BXZ70DRAFT_567030 [Cristinia sonorae]|uniref:XPG-I domain-containing protein n=1 Tax=Cristinia sonorae TaxID=1940300 RepID=A0A8K0UGN1_9AGAR|nr:hypothetical protein BXZ70DRAFT_567030 [Cristinia sonorae]
MGVAGLWDVLRPAGKVRSLLEIPIVDGFEKNKDGVRGFRIGIDASIWFYHAAYGREGENPELRTLFFRCTRLMRSPYLPLFVFDGEERPNEKRGKRITGSHHWMVQGMQKMIEAFGFEWHIAPGEAEAELAYLNSIGVIDGILSDDVDNFLFGAEMVIRNPSAKLSGNKTHAAKNSAGKVDDFHTFVFNAKDLRSREDVQLTRGGLILIGLLRGGDYDQAGLPGCGVGIAHGLAKCGFGDSLFTAARSMSKTQLEHFVDGWREELREELRTNSKKLIGRKNPALARSIPSSFPDLDIVLSYTNPITSESKGITNFSRFNWEKEPDIAKIAGVCELYFEWGVKDIILKRFRRFLWGPAVLRILRRSTLLLDRQNGSPAIPATPGTKIRDSPASGTPSKMITQYFSALGLSSPQTRDGNSDDGEEDKLIAKIHLSRKHTSTDHILEYRLEIQPAQLVRLAESGIRGLRTEIQQNSLTPEEEEELGGDVEEDEKNVTPETKLRVWMPACLVDIAEPALAAEFRAKQEAKAMKKRAPKPTAKKPKAAKTDTPSKPSKQPSPPRPRAKTAKSTLDSSDEHNSDDDVLPSLPEFCKPSASQASQRTDMDDDSVDGPSGSIPPPTLPQPEKSRPASLRANIDGFLKASKRPTVAAKTSKVTTKTSRVASLFENIVYTDDTHEPPSVLTSSKSVPRDAAMLSSSRPTGKGIAAQRTPSILSLLDEDELPISNQPSTSSARAKAKPSTSFARRPFPLDFDDIDPPRKSLSQPTAFPTQSKLTRRRDTSDSETAASDSLQEKVRKSPRKSKSRDSPRHTRTQPSDILSRQRSVSPSPIRNRPLAMSQPKLTAIKYSYPPAGVIEISSDEEDEIPAARASPPKPLGFTSKQNTAAPPPKPRKDMSDIIDLT